MDVSVCIATFGDHEWVRLAGERALPSVPRGVPTVECHSAIGLCDARNAALERVDTEYVIYLDADDELGSFYIDRMAESEADVRIPLVSYISPGGRQGRPRALNVAGHHHDCQPECLPYGNYIVIGAAVRTQLLRDVGGWRDFPWSEDWDTWARCFTAGATFERTRAVYRAHVRHDSRNRGQSREAKHAAHQAIARANGFPVPA